LERNGEKDVRWTAVRPGTNLNYWLRSGNKGSGLVFYLHESNKQKARPDPLTPSLDVVGAVVAIDQILVFGLLAHAHA
jgi:hypothetical protein